MASRSLTLRSATLEDGAHVLPWRNHPETRKYFRDPHPIPANAHTNWWSAAVEDPKRHLFIAEVGKLGVGVVRLDDDDDSHSSTVSIYLDPDLTGLGLGKLMLSAVQQWSLLRQEGRSLRADIHSQNTASQGIFRAARFQQQRDGWWWLPESSLKAHTS